MRIDPHTHSRVSDGTDSPTQLVQRAARLGVHVIALTDHDTFDGVAEAMAAGDRAGVVVASGVEMSTRYSHHPVHLLGYGCHRDDRPLLEELRRIQQSRSSRLAAMADALSAAGMEMSVAEIRHQAGASPSVGRPHVADLMMRKGYVGDRDEAFRDWLKPGRPGFVPRYATDLTTAIAMIRAAGGAAVIAHPWGRGGERVVTAGVLRQLRDEHGLDGIEVDHQDHDPDARDLLSRLGQRLGLIRTGSSDHHGSGKLNHELGCNTTRPSAWAALNTLVAERGGQPSRR